MNIEKISEEAINPLAIVSDLIEDFCAEYEENPLTIAHENNNKKIAELDYLEPDDMLIDMLRSADIYIYNTYRRLENNDQTAGA